MIQVKSREEHEREIKSISIRPNLSLKSKTPSNTLRSGAYKKETIDISSLNSVLTFDPDVPSITVEPRITFRELCRFTLKYGFIPPVVPEFASITVGGAIMGAALESSSHRFGQVSDTCLEYEILLGNGEVTTASPEKNSDLFYGISGSYGTLGILTSVKMRLIKAEKWVRLTFHHLPFDELVPFLTTSHEEDFIEGLVLNRFQSIAVTGKMSPFPPSKIFRQDRPWSKWYIQYASNTSQKEEIGMRLEEYLFRLDRGAFWMGRFLSWKAMFQLLFHMGIPKIKPLSYPGFLFRFFFGWALTSQKLYRMWHRVPNRVSENLFFIHDFYTPASRAKEALLHFIEKTDIFPIWLCPMRGTKTAQFLSPHYGNENFLNIGLYGIPKAPSIPKLSAELEKDILTFGGRKMLYSFTYYELELFSKIYQDPLYSDLRKKYHAEEIFPTLYTKVKKK